MAALICAPCQQVHCIMHLGLISEHPSLASGHTLVPRLRGRSSFASERQSPAVP